MRSSTCIMHPLVKTGQQLVTGMYKGNLLGRVYVCYVGGELCGRVRKARNNQWVACTHGHQERPRRRRPPKTRHLFCSGPIVATVVTWSWYHRARRPTRGIPARCLVSETPGKFRERCATGRTHPRADGSARRPDVYRGGEVRTQCVHKVVKVHMRRSVHVTGSGGQSGEVDPTSFYGRDVCMNEVVTLDRLRQVGSRGATRAGPWLEELRVRDD